VIVRITTIAVPKTQLPEYYEYMENNLVPRYTNSPGLSSIQLLKREFVAYDEITTISSWDSEEAMNAFLETKPFDRTPFEFAGIEFEPRLYHVLMSKSRDVPY
jgi:heme-degrading monooxygenase HmoA